MKGVNSSRLKRIFSRERLLARPPAEGRTVLKRGMAWPKIIGDKLARRLVRERHRKGTA